MENLNFSSSFTRHDPTKLTVVHGSNNFLNGTVVTVAKIIPHPKYGDFKNDIALLKLTNQLKFDNYTKAIALRNSEVPVGAIVVISGFGRTGFNDPVSENLKYNKMVVVSDVECATGTGIDYEGLLCFNADTGNGACRGDSGGPAIYEDTLVGVADFVINGCGTESPDGYAKVSFFLDWIRENTNDSKPVLKFL
jgi:secreted trypsin-like serine protease